MDMRKFLIISIIILYYGCKEQSIKSYKDYNEQDFVEVQGLIIKVEKEFAYQNRKVDVTYIYNLEKDKPTVGHEKNTPFIPMAGEPKVILVHKYEENVTFLGGNTYIEDEKDLIKKYLEKSARFGVEYYGVDQKELD
ncbi:MULTISPECIES: hypothetical protein [unclassified Cellulophaga]|uniref:hypothetical protein n=1 Tax=unclassified Cellulophaga TaxID=2634405 RepID=UPI0026E11708|nr:MULTISPECIES: hypothetical protein [unclassified Cellulophaga]MDO6493091.1 hypothetical protein [Cellulophaga sp. 2_MG-2023]MDO6496412.1 hypothetical protein [Cellulophaga sp. 3_MG-2023]